MIFFLILFNLIAGDPVPVGGASCIQNSDCGGLNAGTCVNNSCVCPPKLANVSCSYQRHDGTVAGALNIALPFVGVGGVGNFIIGRTGMAVGQLLLMLSIYIVLIPSCIIGCCCGLGNKVMKYLGYTLVVIIIILAIAAGFAGFIWSIVDGANMLKGELADGNGFSLYRSS